jgi:pimeloyl-ACP methyl ester carboxylesterase
VRPLVGTLVALLMATCAWICGPTASASAQIAFAPCGEGNEFACGHLTVPLDPSGATPGTVTLALRRHRAAVGEARTAIIALAGGPGQPALPFAELFDEILGPIAATRDLIVFDQRGIGLSDPLSCHAFERPDLYRSFSQAIEACGSQLGAARPFYTTADTVADIEAIRQAGGYEKLVLYGTSYGTKVAEEYAQQYPGHVEALVLDSVVPPNGPEPLNRATFAAIPRILRQMCSDGMCAHVTSHPIADLARLLARIRRAPLRGRAIDAQGRAHEVPITADELFEALLAGDFSPSLRAEFLTGVAAAARGDTAPLARLLATAGGEAEEREDFDTPLYYATSCEDQDFPWSRTGDASARMAQARTAAKALPASVFAPFTVSTALQESNIPACAHWPYSTPAAPAQDGPLPDVPTLILSGADDLRTPTANAREVAAQIPDAHLLVVPYTGHSVLTDEPTACAREALKALFSSAKVKPCAPAPTPSALRPPPLPPRQLSSVTPMGGYHGLPGRTLHALALTLGDAQRQLSLSLEAISPETTTVPPLSTGGLRAGWARYSGGVLNFHGYSYVPGVTVSGTIGSETADLRVGGAAAAHGKLHAVAHMPLTGVLGGSHVTLVANSRATTAIVEDGAQESSNYDFGSPAARVAAGKLASFLGWVQP